ncbi:CPK4 [Symbiodinium natans]|uniref:CPK4 protein n=1 Tax=Symbiodinium natans TaxID=878477 RepID=A0A812INU8_9DINO|nr:CPK4 [Symbiodinium natans]
MGGSKSKSVNKEGFSEIGGEITRMSEHMGKIAVSGRYHRKPRRIGDDYKIHETVLGSGYNGVVNLATSIGLDDNMKFAVKAFKIGKLKRDKKAQLESEVGIYLCMDHPHITRLFDVYEADDYLYLVMECMEGGELFDRVTTLKRFTERDAADAVTQMLLALNYIHSHGIVHRDLKLENFLYESKTSNHLKLIDFGFSKVWDPNIKMHVSCGTLAYVAPEVLKKDYGSQCDIWSLGVIAFVLLSGYMPFSGSESVQTKNIAAGNYILKPERWSSVSIEGRQFVKAVLEVNPQKRLTAATALQHVWIKNRHDLVPWKDVDDGVVEALRKFGHTSKFRRACMEMMAWSLSQEERAQVQEAFIALDHSQQGTIKLADLKQVMEEKFNVSEGEARKCFDALDTNHDEEIHYSDFLAAMVSTRISLHDHLLKATFKKFDVDSSGYITAANLREVLGDTFEGEQVEKLLSEADILKDNRISYSEFKSYLRGDPMSVNEGLAAQVIDLRLKTVESEKGRRSSGVKGVQEMENVGDMLSPANSAWARDGSISLVGHSIDDFLLVDTNFNFYSHVPAHPLLVTRIRSQISRIAPSAGVHPSFSVFKDRHCNDSEPYEPCQYISCCFCTANWSLGIATRSHSETLWQTLTFTSKQNPFPSAFFMPDWLMLRLRRSLIGERDRNTNVIHQISEGVLKPELLSAQWIHILPLPFDFQSILGVQAQGTEKRLRLASWNVLAQSYSLQKSFPDVKPEWLKFGHRLPLLRDALVDIGADVLCLQEVEALHWQPLLEGLDYEVVFAQRPARADGCLVAFRRTKFRCRQHLVVDFDSLLEDSLPPAVIARFARRNVALVVELEDVQENVSFLIATTHLYWGSEHDDVRAWQLASLLEAAAQSFGTSKPLALCGDLNSHPWGLGCQLLRNGAVEVPRKFRKVERFLVDRDISKAAKPLRLLGLDVMVEKEPEREERPEGAQGLRLAKVPVVARAAREDRVLVSASKRLVARADAALAYFLDARCFDKALARLCLDLSVEINPDRFFTRCVKCNGRVCPLANTEKEHDRAMAFGAPTDPAIPLFTCSLCGQVYWFSQDHGSASARARQQVDRLVELVEKLRQTDTSAPAGEDMPDSAERFLRDGGGRLEQHWQLKSAYEDLEPQSSADVRDKVLTNSKYGFHGCIDYIWLSPGFQKSRLRRLRLPKWAELGSPEVGPLPSLVGCSWPSDHWPLAVDLELRVSGASTAPASGKVAAAAR